MVIWNKGVSIRLVTTEIEVIKYLLSQHFMKHILLSFTPRRNMAYTV